VSSTSVSAARATGTGRSLLELDTELGQLLTAERREAAQHELRVRVSTFPVGEWDGGRLADADPLNLGLLIVEGVLAREVVLGDTVSTELEIGAVIVDRVAERAHRLAVTQAISQLNRVDRRLLALFWHLAERWGRVAVEGVAVPLVLSHRLIGELVGARRPTISTALAELARDGQLVRRDDGTWLLTGEPVAVPEVRAAEVVRQRRRLMPRPDEETPPSEAPAPAPSERLAELQSSLEAAREASRHHRENLDQLQAETAALRERTVELRRRRERHVAELRAAAKRRHAS
jgi:CRP/FNR family transcriptional regulator, cyclic AMP receptor protein